MTDLILSLQSKIDLLGRSQKAMREERCSLIDRISALRSDLAEANKRIESLELDISFLRISHKLADSPEAIVEARRHISALIRKLDTSIALLNEDPAS